MLRHGIILMQTFADPNDPAETQWFYDEPTELLTNKVYDDGNGPSYAYYPDGRLHTRTWARGVTSTNQYSVFGELISTTYSDDTPTVTRQYNRLGQPTKTIQATATDQRITTYEYDTNTFALLSESINGTNTISYTYNSRGQQTGYSSGYAEHQLRISLETDDYGRISALSAIFGTETNTFHYNYLYGSAMVSSITNNLGFGISKYYEDYRNLIIGVSNYFDEDCISSFVYKNDALGRRSQRVDNNIDYSVAITNSFDYNNYSELAEATMNTNDYNFTMDDIGDRTEHLINDIDARYENIDDSNNRYSDTYSTNLVYNQHYDFDLDGNMTTITQYDLDDANSWIAWQYTWNAENRMVSATNCVDGTYVTYKYDYLLPTTLKLHRTIGLKVYGKGLISTLWSYFY